MSERPPALQPTEQTYSETDRFSMTINTYSKMFPPVFRSRSVPMLADKAVLLSVRNGSKPTENSAKNSAAHLYKYTRKPG